METAEVFSELHIERLFLFSLIWSFGGVLLKEKEQKKFSQLLRQLTNRYSTCKFIYYNHSGLTNIIILVW